MTGVTIRLTMAQALVRWLTQQFTEIEVFARLCSPGLRHC